MKPDGITKKTKDNSKKRPYEREQWQKKKSEGRPKQQFINGQWEKIPQ
jgi:hypothetical protein